MWHNNLEKLSGFNMQNGSLKRESMIVFKYLKNCHTEKKVGLFALF